MTSDSRASKALQVEVMHISLCGYVDMLDMFCKSYVMMPYLFAGNVIM